MLCLMRLLLPRLLLRQGWRRRRNTGIAGADCCHVTSGCLHWNRWRRWLPHQSCSLMNTQIAAQVEKDANNLHALFIVYICTESYPDVHNLFSTGRINRTV